MIADQMRKIFAFNDWAWQRLFASVKKLDEETYMAPRLLFEGNMHATLVHCMSAESVWMSRCLGVNPDTLFDPDAYVDFTAVQTAWQPITRDWRSFLTIVNDEDCRRIVEYQNTRGQKFSLPLVDILQHVVNHATEHRSQLTPLLNELGVPTQPLDYMLFQLAGQQ